MAINFPDAPSVNDLFVSGDSTWVWNGTTWASNPSAVPLNTLGDVTISSAVNGEVVQYDGSGWVNADIIAQIVDSAPATLNTLNELAAALGDDANFATTVTNSLAGKQAVVSGVSDTEIGYLDGVSSAIQTQLDAKAPLTPAVNAKTGSYTLVAGDNGEFITCSGTFNITIPSATFAAGDRVDFVNIGTGVITFLQGSGQTINSVDAAVTIDTQWAGATFFFTSSTAGVLVGKLA